MSALVASIAVAALGACLDSGNGLDGSGPGYFALAPVLPAAVQNGQFPLGVNQIGLRLLRSSNGEIVVDTLLPFDPDSAAVHAGLRVGMLRRVEEFQARLSLQSGSLVLFSGSKLIFLQQGPPGTNALDSIHVQYEGPGRDIAQIAIQPDTAIIRLGDSLQFRVAAVDSNGNPVPQFFVSWSVSDSTPGRLNALGWLRGLDARSAATVTAITPNGAGATARALFVPNPTGLRLLGADTVVAPVGSTVPFGVRVVAADSLGVPGVAVHFTTTAGGQVTNSLVMTDTVGIATTQVVVGDTLRDYRYEASAEGLETGRLTVDAVAGAPAALSITEGNTQSAQVGTALPNPVAVRVEDAHGNPVAGQRVNFVVTSGGGSVWAGSNNTNDSGMAMERWTLGTSTAAVQELEARAVDNTTGAPLLFAVFTATALPGAADSLERVAGDGQAGVVGTALADSLAVRVRDRYGNPVPGVTVQWAASQGSLTAGSAASNAEGVSRAAWVLGQTPGAQQATATAGTLAPASFGATAAAGSPAAMAAQGGTAQAGVVASVLAESLSVRLTDRFGNPVPGVSVTWSAGGGGTVTAAGPSGADGVARAVWRLGTAAGGQTAQAATGSLTASFSATAEAGPPAQVSVSGSGSSLDALGAQLTLGAVVHDAFGNPVPNATVAWSSSDTLVALVDATGRVTARHDGTARITATAAGSAAGFLDVTVAQVVASVSVSPQQTTLSAVGASVQLELTVLDPNGNPLSQPQVTWESSNTQVATVSGSGLVTAVGAGQVTITATVGGSTVETVTLSVTVSVMPTVAAVVVSPATGTLIALGQTLTLQGSAVDAEGTPVSGVSLSWHSSSEGVATVSGGGVVTAVANGTATITATGEGASGSAAVTVSQAPALVAVSPAAVSLSALGATAQLGAVVEDANGHPVAGTSVAWASSNDAAATVSGTGLVTAVANGTATIRATSGGASGSAAVSVSQAVASVEVTPATVTLTTAGEQATLTAVARDARGNVVTGAAMEWSSGDAAVATADGSGVVTAVSNGNAVITAASGGTSGTASVTVAIPAPQVGSVQVTPGSATLTGVGATVQLTATVLATDGSVLDGASVAWTSSNDAVATVSETGLVTAVANGTATITAASGGKSAGATVTVSVPATPLIVVIRVGAGDTKTVNLGSQGSTPVAILTTSVANGDPVTFDAATVDPSTVRFEGVAPLNWSLADVDGDGDLDLQLHFETSALALTVGTSITVTLTGRTGDGVAIEGQEQVTVIANGSGPRSSQK